MHCRYQSVYAGRETVLAEREVSVWPHASGGLHPGFPEACWRAPLWTAPLPLCQHQEVAAGCGCTEPGHRRNHQGRQIVHILICELVYMLQDITAQTYWRIAQNYTSLHVESCINRVAHFCSVTAACRGPYGRCNEQRCRGRDCTEEPHLSHAQHQWDEPDQHCAQHCLSACCWNWLGEYFTCVSMLSVCLAVCVCVCCMCWAFMVCVFGLLAVYGMWNVKPVIWLLPSLFLLLRPPSLCSSPCTAWPRTPLLSSSCEMRSTVSGMERRNSLQPTSPRWNC